MIKKCFKYILLVFVVILFALASGFFFIQYHAYHYADDETRKKDVSALYEEEQELLLLTMYSGNTVSETPFEYYLGFPTYQAKHSFGNLADYTDYLDTALSSQENLREVYSFFDPAEISSAFFFQEDWTIKEYQETLRESILGRPDVNFVFLLPSYSMEYWCSLSDKKIENSLESYILFCDEFAELENVKIYFYGYLDWVISNPENFAGVKECHEDLNTRMIALTIWNDDFRVNKDNIRLYVKELSDKIAGEKEGKEVPDLSEYEIVFLGDSVIGNYTGPRSIPGVIKSLTGAEVFNCAIGGQAAAKADDEKVKSMTESLEYFLQGQPEDAFGDKQQFLSEVERFREKEHAEEKLCFVLSYGLNDYFSGKEIEDPANLNDIYTYCGALRTGVEWLKEAYPDARIILTTPTFVRVSESSEQDLSKVIAELTEYVDAVVDLAETLDVQCIDQYKDLGFNEENGSLYYEDGCHLNERGRYLYAENLINFLS